jgi:hypothetical protein
MGFSEPSIINKSLRQFKLLFYRKLSFALQSTNAFWRHMNVGTRLCAPRLIFELFADHAVVLADVVDGLFSPFALNISGELIQSQ